MTHEQKFLKPGEQILARSSVNTDTVGMVSATAAKDEHSSGGMSQAELDTLQANSNGANVDIPDVPDDEPDNEPVAD